MTEVIMTVGFPASGKSTATKKYMRANDSYVILSRDLEGGKVASLLPKLEKTLDGGHSVILDCTFMKLEARKPFIDICKKKSIPIKCLWMTTSAEDCQINALNRMWGRYGKIFLDGEALKEVKTDPNMFLGLSLK